MQGQTIFDVFSGVIAHRFANHDGQPLGLTVQNCCTGSGMTTRFEAHHPSQSVVEQLPHPTDVRTDVRLAEVMVNRFGGWN